MLPEGQRSLVNKYETILILLWAGVARSVKQCTPVKKQAKIGIIKNSRQNKITSLKESDINKKQQL